MKTTFEYVAFVINEKPEDSTITAFDIKKACKAYYLQMVPIGTISAYIAKLIACGFLIATDVKGKYRIFAKIPVGYTIADLDAKFAEIAKEKRSVRASALDVQIGGSHYKKYAYQPVEFAVHAELSFIQGNIVKYITRYNDKNGVEDIKKVIHYSELAMQLRHSNKIKEHKQMYAHKFCVENKLNTLQVEVIKAVINNDYKHIINTCKQLC